MRAVRIAFLVGVIHAAFSLYWALGGTWLLDTVGQGPQDFVKSGPLSASLVLGLIALFKALAITAPGWRSSTSAANSISRRSGNTLVPSRVTTPRRSPSPSKARPSSAPG